MASQPDNQNFLLLLQSILDNATIFYGKGCGIATLELGRGTRKQAVAVLVKHSWEDGKKKIEEIARGSSQAHYSHFHTDAMNNLSDKVENLVFHKLAEHINL